MSDTFDKLAASRPVNSQAARVMGRGVHYEPKKKIKQRHWTAPPVCKPLTQQQLTDPLFENFTGQKFGRFTVVGYLGSFSPGQPAFWLCRCSCGDFESRRARSIRNPDNRGDRCEVCRNLVQLRRTESWLRNPTAKQPDSLSEL